MTWIQQLQAEKVDLQKELKERDSEIQHNLSNISDLKRNHEEVSRRLQNAELDLLHFKQDHNNLIKAEKQTFEVESCRSNAFTRFTQ